MYVGLNYIDGDFTPHSPDFPSINPCYNTEIGMFPQSTESNISEALDCSRKAFKKWRKVSKPHRAEFFDKLCSVMKNHSKKIVDAISLETGKSKNESLAEFNEALHMAQFVFGKGREVSGQILPSEIAEKDAYLITKPKGVVGIISAWNFPFAIGGFWWAAPAILEGNTVVFKPSEDTPMVGQLIAELYDKAGFPPGVFNLLHGDGEVGASLVKDERVNHICFTGSADVGRHIRISCANSWHKTCACEMGSKSAVIVCEDAPELALDACVASAYKLSGQRCVSSGRMLIHRSLYDDFCSRFVDRSKNLVIGDPMELDIDMGPLINQSQMERVMDFNRQASNDSGTNVLLEGRRFDGQGCENGFFLTPHVYTAKWEWQENRSFLKNEVFGPHVALIPFNTLDEAIDIYNDTDYGLSLAVCTTDYTKMKRIREECDFGLGYANLPSIGAESQLPFGGVKKSGNGLSSAAGTFDHVVHKVTWTVNHEVGSYKMAQGLKS